MHSDQPVNSHRTAGRINAYEKVIPYHKHNTQDLCKADPESHTFPENFLTPFQISGAKVLAGKGHCCLCKRCGDIISKIFKIQCQGGTSDRIFPKGIDPALYEYILSYV